MRDRLLGAALRALLRPEDEVGLEILFFFWMGGWLQLKVAISRFFLP